jgi:hypothetical protein
VNVNFDDVRFSYIAWTGERDMMSRFSALAAIAVVTALGAAPHANAAAPSREELAEEILNDKGIGLLDSHVGGQSHPASTARQNVVDTSKGEAARTSPWSDVGVTKVKPSADLLRGMVALGKDYDYRVTTIAGGDHSANSYHYAGSAVDIDRIDGRAVSAGNPEVAKVKSACKELGAVEILGPGDAGHDSHVHCAWKP